MKINMVYFKIHISIVLVIVIGCLKMYYLYSESVPSPSYLNGLREVPVSEAGVIAEKSLEDAVEVSELMKKALCSQCYMANSCIKNIVSLMMYGCHTSPWICS